MCDKQHLAQADSSSNSQSNVEPAGSIDKHLQFNNRAKNVVHLEQTLQMENPEDKERAIHTYLAYKHWASFKQTGDLEELDASMSHDSTVLESCPEDHPDYSISLHNLATSLQTRFERCGQMEDLDNAIGLHRIALECFPEGHPDCSASLNNLANSLTTRFNQCGQMDDLHRALLFHHAALDRRPEGHPARSQSLNNLASSLKVLFEQDGRTEVLEEAIGYHRAALRLCPESDPGRPMCLNNLAGSLQMQFERCGRLEDLDESIALQRAALALYPNSHPDRSTSLGNLASSIKTRFEQHGRMDDLDEAIALYRASLELRPEGHPGRSSSLNNLAISLRTQFEHHDQMEDLDEAVEHHHAALALRPEGHPLRSSSLNNLANTLATRFERYRRTEDNDESISLLRTALALRPEGHPGRPSTLNNLAGSLSNRFEQHGRKEDIDEAIALHRMALELRPEGDPTRSASLESLTRPLFSRFEKFGFMDDFEECMQMLERATQHKFSSSMKRLKSASRWAELARKHTHSSTSKAYKVAISLLQRALIVSPTLQAQHDFLVQEHYYRMLALESASHLIQENQLEHAVEILEQGRGLLWSQMRGFRTPLDRLSEIDKGLADRFGSVSRRLENLVTSHEALISGSDAAGHGPHAYSLHRQQQSFDKMLTLKRQLSNEQEEIISEIRQLPGFESFLAATPFKVLQKVAVEGPVIMINHCKYRTDALIILSRKDTPVVCVPLDDGNEKVYTDFNKLCDELLETRRCFKADSTEYGKILRQTMKTLWDRIVFKIDNKLEELGIAEGSRIWWCPTSTLSALPFHAAGPLKDADGNTKYLLDKYISSYTPTLGALINARSCGNGEQTVLIIGDESLKSARGEIRNIKNCGITTKLLLKTASRNAVIKALGKTRWVHFVCHGNLGSKPFNSFFKLPELKQENKDCESNQKLSLLDIVQGNVPNAEFAFLSACHTAEQPHGGAHDEVLHLAAAMQFSGFRSVIGSMWELLDVDGPFFARTVYEYIWGCDKGEARHKRAAAGLRKAAVELKARSDIETERWVNLVHIGA